MGPHKQLLYTCYVSVFSQRSSHPVLVHGTKLKTFLASRVITTIAFFSFSISSSYPDYLLFTFTFSLSAIELLRCYFVTKTPNFIRYTYLFPCLLFSFQYFFSKGHLFLFVFVNWYGPDFFAGLLFCTAFFSRKTLFNAFTSAALNSSLLFPFSVGPYIWVPLTIDAVRNISVVVEVFLFHYHLSILYVLTQSCCSYYNVYL